MKALVTAGFFIAMLAFIAALPRKSNTRDDNQAGGEAANLEIPNEEPPEGEGPVELEAEGEPSDLDSASKPPNYLPAAADPPQYDVGAELPYYSDENSESDIATLEYPTQPFYKTLLDEFGSIVKAVVKLPSNLLRAVSVVVNGREYTDRAGEMDFGGCDSGEEP